MSNTTALWLLFGFTAFLVGVAIANWWVAERDEKRWRRIYQEEQRAAIVREHRYGSGKSRGI